MAESIAFFFFFLLIFILLCITFFYTLTYEHVGKIQKKRKRKLNTHTQLHTDKKERKKHTPVPSSLFI